MSIDFSALIRKAEAIIAAVREYNLTPWGNLRTDPTYFSLAAKVNDAKKGFLEEAGRLNLDFNLSASELQRKPSHWCAALRLLQQAERIATDGFSSDEKHLEDALVRLKEVSPKKRRRRRQTSEKTTPLTPEQLEAMQLIGEHKGNLTKAGKAAGKSRQAMARLYKKATTKLGSQVMKKFMTQALPTDQKGQYTVHDPKEAKPPRGRVTKKRIESD